jgi:uncharacterized membrane protein YjfL (UPF0719 family)
VALDPVVNSIVYALLGITILVLAFWVIDRLTPGELWKELLERQNSAVAIVAAGLAIAVGLIIASAIH